SEIAAEIAAETDASIEGDSDVGAEIEPVPNAAAPASDIDGNVARDPAIDAAPAEVRESEADERVAADTPVANDAAADIDVENAHAPNTEDAEAVETAADPLLAAPATART